MTDYRRRFLVTMLVATSFSLSPAFGQAEADPFTAGDVCADAAVANLRTVLRTDSGQDADRLAAMLCLEERSADETAAMVALGDLYRDGAPRIDKDEAGAAELYTRAAEAGDAAGSSRLARLLLTGRGVEQDLERAVELYLAIAETDKRAYLTLGEIYSTGQFRPADLALAAQYLQSAVDGGVEEALVPLGDLVRKGWADHASDAARAEALFQRAANLGISSGSLRLASMLVSGEATVPDLQRGIALYEQHAADNPAIYVTLANLYLDGKVTEADGAKAVDYLARAVLAGRATAALTLGDLYRDGAAGLKSDPQTALKYYRDAAEAEVDGAKARIAALHLREGASAEEVEEGLALFLELAAEQPRYFATLGDHFLAAGDGARAGELYQQGVDAGHTASLVKLGDLYRKGETGIAADAELARTLYQRAADEGVADGMGRLASMLALGEGGAADGTGAVKLYEAAAALDAKYFINLGNLFARGDLVEADGPQAVRAFEAAIAARQRSALLLLGDLYRTGGGGLPADVEQAIVNYQAAADANIVEGNVRLGDMYLRGQGVPVDIEKGVTFYEAAAARSSRFWNVLGDMFARGNPVPADGERALGFYGKAVEAGRQAALVAQGDLYRDGMGGIAADEAAAFAYYEQAADADVPEGSLRMGLALIEGAGVAQDVERGVALIEALAETDASYFSTLGGIFSNEGSLDAERAVGYYERAASGGQGQAYVSLGDIYRDGLGELAADPARAADLYESGVVTGSAAAMARLASLYLRGLGVEPDAERGVALYKQAAALDPRYYINLAELYLAGRRVPRSEQQAEQYFELAVAAGNVDARNRYLLYRVGSARSMGEFGRLYEEYSGYGASHLVVLFKQLRQANANFYVYVIQQRLAEQGLFSGTSNGLLGQATISALNRACTQWEIADICRASPLSSATANALANRLF